MCNYGEYLLKKYEFNSLFPQEINLFKAYLQNNVYFYDTANVEKFYNVYIRKEFKGKSVGLYIAVMKGIDKADIYTIAKYANKIYSADYKVKRVDHKKYKLSDFIK